MFKNRLTPILFALFIIVPALTYLLAYYTDWLFFVETGFASVFTTKLYAQTGIGVLFGGLLFAFLVPNLLYANRAEFPHAGEYIEAGAIRLQRNQTLPMIRPIGVLIAAGIALFVGQFGALQWENVLLFINRVSVGTTDPVIGKDIGFYLFSLPLLEILRGYLNFMLLATLLVTLLV